MPGLGGAASGAAGAIRAGRAYVEMYLDDNRVIRALAQIKTRFTQLGSFLQSAGLKSIMSGVGIATPLAAATSVFIGFDDAIRTAKAAVGATSEEFAKLEDLAKKLGRTTSFTATDVANLMIELGRAGFSVPQIEKMTEAVLNLARATGITAPEAAAVMSATIRQFGLDASEAANVADLLTKTANASFTSVQGIGETLQYVGPVAKDLGLSLTDTLALVGALGNVGIQGSEAGTALRRLGIIAAAEPEKFRAIGVATSDAGGNLRDLVDIMDDVFNATKNLGNADRAKVFNDIFGLLGITSASALSSNAKGVRELRDEIAKSGGVAAATAREMDAGIGGAWRRFKAAVEAVAIAVGEALTPTLMEFGAGLSQLADGVIRFIKENQALAGTIARVAVGLIAGGAALVAFGLAFKVVAVAVGAVLGVLGLVKVAVLALLTPYGLVAAAVTGLVVAWATMTDSGKAAVNSVKGLLSDLAATAAKTWGGIVDAFKAGNLQLAVDVATVGVKLAWAQAMEFLLQRWVNFKASVESGWGAMSDKLGELLLTWKLGVTRIFQGEDAAKKLATDLGNQWGEMQRAEQRERERNAANDPAVLAARREVEAARARLNALTEQAAREKAAKELAAMEDKAAEERRIADQRAKKGSGGGGPTMAQLIEAVAGGYASNNLQGQYRYSGETFQKRALTAAEATAKNTAEAAVEISRLAFSMRFN